VRPWLKRDDSFPQSLALGKRSGYRPRACRGTRDGACRPRGDPDLGGARLRARRHRLFGFAVAQAVRLAERARDDRRARRGFIDPAADRDVPDESLPSLEAAAAITYFARCSVIEAPAACAPAELIVTDWRSPWVESDKFAAKAGPVTLTLMRPGCA